MAFLFLISSTELHELARLPKLVAHYLHHRSEDPGMSLSGFLSLHYAGYHPDDRDDNDDRQLPFKDTKGILQNDLLAVETQCFASLPALPPAGNVFPVLYNEGMLQQRSYSIFHPPRLA